MKYGAILIDPPWRFVVWGEPTSSRSTETHYSTMTGDDLAKLPVKDFAAKDCAMFMWVVDTHIPQALQLMDGWGFKFKTVAFVWSKPSIGMGWWTRKDAEICLLGTRGSPPRQSKGVRQTIFAPRREHSRKPDEIYDRIEKLVAGPYLEMFARQRRAGWDAWGNEIDKFVVNPFED